jgi:hypothetical protein
MREVLVTAAAAEKISASGGRKKKNWRLKTLGNRPTSDIVMISNLIKIKLIKLYT